MDNLTMERELSRMFQDDLEIDPDTDETDEFYCREVEDWLWENRNLEDQDVDEDALDQAARSMEREYLVSVGYRFCEDE